MSVDGSNVTIDRRTDAWIVRLVAWGGVIGSLFATVGNLLHPATPTDDPARVAGAIAQGGIWVPVHLVIVVRLILMLGGLVAISRSIEGGMAGALARLDLAGPWTDCRRAGRTSSTDSSRSSPGGGPDRLAPA